MMKSVGKAADVLVKECMQRFPKIVPSSVAVDWTTKGAVTPVKNQVSLDAGSNINTLTFSPKNCWLCAATDTSIKVLENKSVLDELHSTAPPKCGIPWCVSLQWSANGNVLFAGATDGNVHVRTMLVAYDHGLPRRWLVPRHQNL